MKNVMVDLETLSTRPNAAIVSIGAVFFDKDEGLGEEFECVLDLDYQVKELGRHIAPGTVKWWLDQTADAKAVFKRPTVGVYQALDYFAMFLGGPVKSIDVKVWGNGASFDNVILGSLYEDAGVAQPWQFWNDRCFRTLKSEARSIMPPQFKGTAHNALADAKHQAEWAMQILRNGRIG